MSRTAPVIVCSRCGATLAYSSWKRGRTRPCIDETCAGTMRKLRVIDVRKDAQAKQELQAFGL